MRGIQFQPTLLAVALAAVVSFTGDAVAQKKYDAGATDTEIKIGNIMPYSGPASAYSAIGKTEAIIAFAGVANRDMRHDPAADEPAQKTASPISRISGQPLWLQGETSLGSIKHALRGFDFVVSAGGRWFDVTITAFSISIR
jgi:hypothetical protein